MPWSIVLGMETTNTTATARIELRNVRPDETDNIAKAAVRVGGSVKLRVSEDGTYSATLKLPAVPSVHDLMKHLNELLKYMN